MLKRKFGSTEIETSILGFGAGHIGSPEQSEKDVERILNTVVDEGITLIDTARGYNLSEERIGKYLSYRRRDYILSTKVGYGIEGYEDWTYDCVIEGINEALRRLNTDYIDIVHLHSCSLDILKRGDVIEALHKAKKDGKIRVAAYSGENKALEYAAKSNLFDSLQCSINICDQRVIDNQLKIAKENNIGVIAKRPIANAPWRFSKRPEGHYCEPYWGRLNKMKLNTEGFSLHQLALRFTAYLEGVHSCIVGTSNIKHLKENIEIINQGVLPTELVKEVREKFRANDDNWIGQV
ncbi:aldo/keto reductase [Orenia marismortui]|uniref:Aryl-alcohol dehydrogenase-like predicted oxidoreductase n=1 Tax=Orenia marismortui TaxID=46469 RepID=A0A4R8H1I3_9FIRM|nr:aldo/keto reductase [Orenia marismortui]TDX48248.1 aryl-alcohol dehydrogenase-like predicted oxidoreductase [Orenia marismortui]